VGAADATPSGVSRVRVTQTSLREGDIGLHRTVTVDSHRQRTDTSYKCLALASLEWTCFPLPLIVPLPEHLEDSGRDPVVSWGRGV